MRQLLPHPADDVDLVEAYGYPLDRPWVRANMVASVDGAAALAGVTHGLSGSADRRAFSVLRHLADVVLVGAGTARAEGYGAEPVRAEHADRRAAAGQPAAPVMAVVSRSLDLDPASALFTDAPNRSIVITCAAAPTDRRRALDEVADVVDAGDTAVEMGTAVDLLVGRGLRRISCEGGPTLLTALLDADRLDELCFTLSPMIAGGRSPRLLSPDASDRTISLDLAHLLEADGFVFARYVVDRPTA